MNYLSFITSSGYLVGYLIIFAILFAESGLFFGFFLPGDSLLIGLGILASQGHFNVLLILVVGIVAAITGDSVGYAFGRRIGPSLFQRKDSLLFRKDNLVKAHAFYEEHGPMTIILARFTPFVRTFAPILAGISEMRYRDFLAYNVIGGVAWICSITLLGYFLGSRFKNIDHYLLPLVLAIVVVSAIPTLLHLRINKKKP